MWFENVQNPEHDVDPGDPFWVTGIDVKLNDENRLAQNGLAGFRRFKLTSIPMIQKWIIGIDVVFRILYIFVPFFTRFCVIKAGQKSVISCLYT